MGFGEPKMPTPEEMAKIQKERTLNDAELLKDGADYKFSEEGSSRLEATKEQIDSAKTEMGDAFHVENAELKKELIHAKAENAELKEKLKELEELRERMRKINKLTDDNSQKEKKHTRIVFGATPEEQKKCKDKNEFALIEYK